MAVSINVIAGFGPDTHIADVTATADADTTATIPHGMGEAPAEFTVTPLQQPLGALSLWAVEVVDATNVVCTKATTAGSGGAGAQLRVIIKRPHTIGR